MLYEASDSVVFLHCPILKSLKFQTLKSVLWVPKDKDLVTCHAGIEGMSGQAANSSHFQTLIRTDKWAR